MVGVYFTQLRPRSKNREPSGVVTNCLHSFHYKVRERRKSTTLPKSPALVFKDGPCFVVNSRVNQALAEQFI